MRDALSLRQERLSTRTAAALKTTESCFRVNEQISTRQNRMFEQGIWNAVRQRPEPDWMGIVRGHCFVLLQEVEGRHSARGCLVRATIGRRPIRLKGKGAALAVPNWRGTRT